MKSNIIALYLTFSCVSLIGMKSDQDFNYDYKFTSGAATSVETREFLKDLYYLNIVREDMKFVAAYICNQDKQNIFQFDISVNWACVCYNPDKEQVVYSISDKNEDQDSIFVVNKNSREIVTKMKCFSSANLVLSNDGASVIAIPDDVTIPIKIFNTTTGDETMSFSPLKNKGDQWYRYDCNTDFTLFAGSIFPFQSIYLYKISSSSTEPTLLETRATSVKFSPYDLHLLASCNNQCIEIWNTNVNECIKKISTSRAVAVAWYPDGVGKTIVSAHGDVSSVLIKFWNRETGDLLHMIECPSSVMISLKFNKTGEWMMADFFTLFGFWEKMDNLKF